METKEQTNPQQKPSFSSKLMTSMMVGTSVEFQHSLMGLMSEYEKKGIQEISIEVLKQMMFESTMKTISPEGLVGSQLKEFLKGE